MQGGHKLANKTTLEIIGEVVDTNVLNHGIVIMATIITDQKLNGQVISLDVGASMVGQHVESNNILGLLNVLIDALMLLLPKTHAPKPLEVNYTYYTLHLHFNTLCTNNVHDLWLA